MKNHKTYRIILSIGCCLAYACETHPEVALDINKVQGYLTYNVSPEIFFPWAGGDGCQLLYFPQQGDSVRCLSLNVVAAPGSLHEMLRKQPSYHYMREYGCFNDEKALLVDVVGGTYIDILGRKNIIITGVYSKEPVSKEYLKYFKIEEAKVRKGKGSSFQEIDATRSALFLDQIKQRKGNERQNPAS